MMYSVKEWKKFYHPYTEYHSSKFDMRELPEHYDVDLEKLDKGIQNTLNNFEMYQYQTPNGDFWPGYFGLNFKSTPDAKNPLQDGNFSNSLASDWSKDDYIDPNFTEKTDAWFSYFDTIVNKFRGTVTQLKLIKLEAGCNIGIYPSDDNPYAHHIDYPWYQGVRLHICLTPDIEYVWNILGTDHYAERNGKIYFLDAGKPHDAKNKQNNVDRYVLNINLIPMRDNSIDYQIENSLL